MLARLALIRIDQGILAVAASLDPPDLRARDALHLATALSVRADLAVFVTYDHRLAAAARAVQLKVLSPA